MRGDSLISLPPELPVNVVVKTRIRALQALAETEQDARRKSVLEYEIASITEHKRGDISKAIKLYLSSYNHDSSFRPPLFALARIFERRSSFDNLRRIYDSAIRVARSDSERASHMIDLAVLLYDYLDEMDRAVALLEEASSLDKNSAVAALMLEQHYSAVCELDDLERVIDERASRTRDPSLKAVLLGEVGRARLKQGDIERAVELLKVASTIPQYRYRSFALLEHIARANDLHDVLVEALEGRASLAEHAAFEYEQRVESQEQTVPRPISVINSAQEAFEASVAFWREAGRIRMAWCNDPVGAAKAYECALRIRPDDLLLRQERLIASERAFDLDAVASQTKSLLEGNRSGKMAAALYFRLGEVAQARGNIEAAREALTQAQKVDLESGAVSGLLEDSLARGGLYQELIEELESRAGRAQPENAVNTLWRAGLVAADHLGDFTTAYRLLRSAASKASDKTPILRELYDRALEYKAYPEAVHTARELADMVSDQAEQNVLLWDSFCLAFAEIGNVETATEILTSSLALPACRTWAPDISRLVGAAQKNYSLLAQSHEILAERSTSDETIAAHLCAAARILVRVGENDRAIAHLKQAIQYSTSNAYAVPLLEEILMEQGATEEVVHLLRQAAEAKANTKQSEIALLHAGAVAEVAGEVELAARNYEDAIDRDPMALAPLWSLRRLAERTGQAAMLTEALEGLAFREAEIEKIAISNFELGIHRDLSGDSALAVESLRAVLDDKDLATEAALSLLFLPSGKAIGESLDAASALLQESVAEDLVTSFYRDRLASTINRDPGLARQLAMQKSAEQPDDRWAHYVNARTASKTDERAQSLIDLGNTTDDQDAAAVLLLHGLRCHMLGNRGEAVEDSLILALDIAENSPDSVLASIAMDEALTPADDAESRADALSDRMNNATEEARLALRWAHARALLAANRFEEAAQIANDLIAQDDNDLSAWEVLHNAADALQDWRTVMRACDKMAEHCDPHFEVLLLEETAEILLLHYQQTEEAEIRLRTALEIEPGREVAFNLLHDIIASRDNDDELLALLEDRIGAIENSEELIDLYYEQSRLHRSKGDRDGALATLQKLLELNRNHIGALGLKAEIHASMEQWAEAISSLSQLAETDIPLEQKRLAWLGAADLLEKKQANPLAAYEALEKVVFAQLGDRQTFSKMADLALGLGKVRDAAAALVLAAEKSEGTERAGFERRAGQLFANQLSDRRAAMDAFARALVADPLDEVACRSMIDLVIDPIERTEVLESFESRVKAQLVQMYDDESLLRKLYKISIWRDERDSQLLALQRLAETDVANPEELSAYETLCREAPVAFKGRLGEASIALLMPERDTAELAEIARLASEAVVEMRIFDFPDEGKTQRVRVKPRDKNPVREALSKVVGIFVAKFGDFYLGGADPHGIAAVSSESNAFDWVVGSQVTAPLSASQRFAVGYRAMAMRLGVYPLFARGSVGRAYQLIAAISEAVEAPLSGSDSSESEKIVRAATHALSRRTRKSLHAKFGDLGANEEPLRAYCTFIHRSCQRAGLLVAGSLKSVLNILHEESADVQNATSASEAQQLVAFYFSRELLALRREIGMAP